MTRVLAIWCLIASITIRNDIYSARPSRNGYAIIIVDPTKFSDLRVTSILKSSEKFRRNLEIS